MRSFYAAVSLAAVIETVSPVAAVKTTGPICRQASLVRTDRLKAGLAERSSHSVVIALDPKRKRAATDGAGQSPQSRHI
jgi:hypothetical protein